MLPPPADEVVRPHRLHHLIEGNAVVQQLFRIDAHLILLLVAAPAVDLGRAGHRAHGRLDAPVLDRAQVRQFLDALFLRERLARSTPLGVAM